MRIFTVVMGCLLSMMFVVSTTAQARNTLSQEGVFDSLDEMETAHAGMLAYLMRHRDKLTMMLGALGAEAKTVAEWREEWTNSGKTERIARYLDGKSDRTRMWYLAQSKANVEEMAAMGMGDIRVGYIEHWYRFNDLTDEYNVITKDIIKLRQLKIAKKIKRLRKRLAAHNRDLQAMRKSVDELGTKVQETRDIVTGMVNKVKMQNFALNLLNTFLQGMVDGLADASEDIDAMPSTRCENNDDAQATPANCTGN